MFPLLMSEEFKLMAQKYPVVTALLESYARAK